MIKFIPRIESAVIFPTSNILICYCRFQILEYFNYSGYRKCNCQNEGINIKQYKCQKTWWKEESCDKRTVFFYC
jgi:hypothetical protein